MKSTYAFTFTALALIFIGFGCAKESVRYVQGPAGVDGTNGTDGTDGAGLATIITGATSCPNGGSVISIYRDLNNNGAVDTEDTLQNATTICNGTNGDDATTSIAAATPSQCATGGYVFTSSTSDTVAVVCNGTQGSQGIPGLTGPAGAPGTVITPIKFCSSDPSTFPEYGLEIGTDVYAVYWGSTPASSQSSAFFTKLVAGSYYSTGGDQCAFTFA